MKQKIYVVFKTHFDIGFTALAREIIASYGGKMLGDVIKTCENTKCLGTGRRYVWTMPSWPLVQSIDMKNTSREYREKAIELIQEGQIAWHTLPFTTHTEFCGFEEFIRGLKFSTDLSTEFGVWPVSAKMTDVPGHTWIMPSILAKAGVKFLHLGCNAGCKPPDVPRLFWWEGPDGSRVLTFYNKGGYGSNYLPPDDWPYPVWLALMQTNDNIGPQEPEIISEIENAVYAERPDAEVLIGTMDDFYREIIQYHLDIPVVKMDLADSWIHGVGSYPTEVAMLRRARRKLLETEKLMTYRLLFHPMDSGDLADIKKDFNQAFEQGLLFGEHTWGLDVKTSMGGFRHYTRADFLKHKAHSIYKRMEESWEEQRQRARTVDKTANALYTAFGNDLSGRIEGKENKLIVFNTSGQNRDEWIDVSSFIEQLPEGLSDARDGLPVVQYRGNGKAFVYIKNLPAFGHAVFTGGGPCTVVPALEAKAVKTGDTAIIENMKYKISVDCASGKVISLIDKTMGKEWVDSRHKYGFAGYRYDIYGMEDITDFIRNYSYHFYDWLVNDLGRIVYPNCKHQTYSPQCVSVDARADNTGATLVIRSVNQGCNVSEYGDADEITVQIFLPAFNDRIHIRFELKGKHETSMIEAGHFVFPLKLERPRYRINKVGSVVDPSIDICKDANHSLYCLENWVDISDGMKGICFVSKDAPLFSIGGEGIYKYKGEYEEKHPYMYFNAFNNAWGTNFPQWMGGDYVYEFTLFTHEGDWQEGDVARKVSEIVNPPAVFLQKSGSWTGNMAAQWLACEGNIEITAFKPADREDNAFVLRFHEIGGAHDRIRFTFHQPVQSVEICDLQERPCRVLESNEMGEYVVESNPFEIHSLLLRM